MGKCQSLIVASTLCVLLVAPSPGNSQTDSPNGGTAGVTMSLLERNLTDTMLQLRYQIKNESDTDIWICESMDLTSDWGDVEVYVGADNQTLFIQRRLDAPMTGISRNQPIGRYARVPRGQTRTEVLSFDLPVHHQRVFLGRRGQQPPERAARAIVEIGYYEGNLPARVFRLLEEAERATAERRVTLPAYETGLRGMMGGTLYFDESNRSLRARDEQVIIPWTDRALDGEKIVRMTFENLSVLYSAEYAKPNEIRVTRCKRIEVRFRGSPLGFYFPYPQEQSLLSTEEKRSVESLRGFDVTDSRDIMGVADDVSEARGGVFHTDHGAADLTCYRKDGSVLSFAVYDNSYVVTQDGQVFRCCDGLTRLRTLAPQIKALDLRLECAANLKDLWHCLRLYRIVRHAPRSHQEYWDRYLEHGYTIPPDDLRAGEKTYPAAAEWCDILAKSYRPLSKADAAAGLPEQVCPGAGEGRCHYAMNPNCRFDSPTDTVLLFETRAGWNQHGGPELFTLENHDPRGGCVLLNDGTVRFVRTENALRQLRWE